VAVVRLWWDAESYGKLATMQIPKNGLLFWLSNALAAVFLVLVCINFVIASGNRSLQIQVNTRQQYINQSIQLSQLHQQLVSALATIAVKNNNQAIRQILADVGITVSATDKSSGTAPAAAPPASASPPASIPTGAPKAPAH